MHMKRRLGNHPISWDEAAGRLKIGASQGAFPGMLKQRTFACLVRPAGPGSPARRMRMPC